MKAYTYIGCYICDSSFKVFNEAFNECNSSQILPDSCRSYNGYSYIYSANDMTVERCLKICVTTYGYKYAGIISGFDFKFTFYKHKKYLNLILNKLSKKLLKANINENFKIYSNAHFTLGLIFLCQEKVCSLLLTFMHTS